MLHTASPRIDLGPLHRARVPSLRMVIRRSDRVSIAIGFAMLFSFFGTLGKVVFVPGLSKCKGYYVVLPIGLIALALVGTKATWKAMLTCLPVLAYIIYSGATTNREAITQSVTRMGMDYVHAAPTTLSALMLTAQSLFVVAAASLIRHSAVNSKIRVIEVFLIGYLTSLCVGYVFLVGRKLGVLSFEFISNFNTMGLDHSVDGLSRFCPGSDPNNYGILSSCALSIMVLYQLSGVGRLRPRTWLKFAIGQPLISAIWMSLTFVALLFTNTRSALMAFPAAVGWILLREIGPSIRRVRISGKLVPYFVIAGLGLLVGAIALPVAVNNISHLKMLFERFTAATKGEGTAEGRFVMWEQALDRFETHTLFGSGYATHEFIHNTYIQLLCDIGILGVAALIGTAALVAWQFSGDSNASSSRDSHSIEGRFLKYVREIGVLHVLWFAMTNHNFDEFLTWFVVLMILGTGVRLQAPGDLTAIENRGFRFLH